MKVCMSHTHLQASKVENCFRRLLASKACRYHTVLMKVQASNSSRRILTSKACRCHTDLLKLQASNSSRRLLASESADVTTQLDAGSTAAVSSVATNLNQVVSGGTLAVGSTMLCCAFELA